MTIQEVMQQLVDDFASAPPAIPQLGVISYDWRSNVLHGLVDNGVSTQFPMPIGIASRSGSRSHPVASRSHASLRTGMAATFNVDLMKQIGVWLWRAGCLARLCAALRPAPRWGP